MRYHLILEPPQLLVYSVLCALRLLSTMLPCCGRKKNLKPKRTTFQEENKWLLLFAMSLGLYPPGAEILVPWPWARRLLKFYSIWIIWMGSFLYVFLWFLATVLWRVPTKVLLILFRRAFCDFQGVLKNGLILMSERGKTLDELYNTWNTRINTDYHWKRRKEIFDLRMKRTVRYSVFAFAFGGFLLQMPLITLFINRYARGAALTVFFHNPAAWYHPALLTIQFLAFFPGSVQGIGYNIMHLNLLTMALAQSELLQEALHGIFRLSVDEDGNTTIKEGSNHRLCTKDEYEKEITRVRKELGVWVKVHQESEEWIAKIGEFQVLTSSMKNSFLTIYLCLAVFSFPGYLRDKNYIDVVYVGAYMLGYFPPLFYESRLMDLISEAGTDIFTDTYATTWNLYPKDITKALSIISSRTIGCPFTVMTFGVFPDNSETFMAIVQTAYNALSFLLQMDI